MGLAVSQVRLLALTNRKADIELQMQINSKRKQQLTRKATELSQEYYNRLQNTAIMYATSNGYEDVDYNYAMGVTTKGEYDSAFLADLTKEKSTIARKPENKMILTDSFGQVVVNNTIAKAMARVYDDEQGADQSVEDRTTQAIMYMIYNTAHSEISECESVTKLSKQMFKDITGSSDTNILGIGKGDYYDQYYDVIKAMIEHYDDVSLDGGNLCLSGGKYYTDRTLTVEAAPKDGYMYQVYDFNQGASGSGEGNKNTQVFINGTATSITQGIAEPLRRLVEYFAPIFAAGFKNGISMSLSSVSNDNTAGKVVRTTQDPEHTYYYKNSIDDCIEANKDSFAVDSPNYCIIENEDGVSHYYIVKKDSSGNVYTPTEITKTDAANIDIISLSSYVFSSYQIGDGNNSVYENATKLEKLQTGLKSGNYQLCIVGNVQKGTYHKNTSLTYFTHKGWISEKMDSSKREEITAWFNIEQAAISEKETYWDTEIQNLSTELTSVNTEIESVKQLKSNAIKSVFNWGGQ